MIPRYKSRAPKTLAQYVEDKQRASERRKRRQSNVRFIAKMQGVDVLASRTTLRAQLDHLTSLTVRMRDRKVHGGLCLVCIVKERMCILKRSPNPISQAYHIEPRGDDMVRWLLWGIVGSCWACNKGEKESRQRASTRELYRRIHIELLGGGEIGRQRLEDLGYLARQKADFSRADLIAKRDEMKAHLEDGN